MHIFWWVFQRFEYAINHDILLIYLIDITLEMVLWILDLSVRACSTGGVTGCCTICGIGLGYVSIIGMCNSKVSWDTLYSITLIAISETNSVLISTQFTWGITFLHWNLPFTFISTYRPSLRDLCETSQFDWYPIDCFVLIFLK